MTLIVDEPVMITCRICGLPKSSSEFNTCNHKRKKTKYHICKTCNSQKQNMYSKAYRDGKTVALTVFNDYLRQIRTLEVDTPPVYVKQYSESDLPAHYTKPRYIVPCEFCGCLDDTRKRYMDIDRILCSKCRSNLDDACKTFKRVKKRRVVV